MGSPTSALWGHLWRLDASYELEAMDAAAAEIDAVEALVERTRLPLVRWHLLRMQASAAGSPPRASSPSWPSNSATTS